MKLSKRAQNINPSPTLAIDTKAKEMVANGLNVINFGAGEPDFDTPDYIKEAAISAIRAGKTKYTPVTGISSLREAICKKFKLEQGLDYEIDQIVVSTGAKQSIYNAIQVLVQDGDEVILPAPYWTSYLEQIKLTGAMPRIVETRVENGFKLIPSELVKVINCKTRLLILNSPNNPTGTVYTERELQALGDVIKNHNFMVISDEIYDKLIYNGLNHSSIASHSPELKERTIVINGVSKTYAMTGWRIGYAAASHQIAMAMAALQSHSTSNPTSVAQEASMVAISGEQSMVTVMREEFARRRDIMLERILAIPGISCCNPVGAFYLFPNVKAYFGMSYNGKTIRNATDLAEVLLKEAQVAVVPGIAFGNDDYIRLSYACAVEKIEAGLDRVAELIKKIM